MSRFARAAGRYALRAVVAVLAAVFVAVIGLIIYGAATGGCLC